MSSPMTTPGYLLIGAIAGALSLAAVVAALSGKPVMLVGLLITQFFVRDAWAWCAATAEEREAFRQQVKALASR